MEILDNREKRGNMITSDNSFYVYTYVIVTVMAQLDGVVTDEEMGFMQDVLKKHQPTDDFDIKTVLLHAKEEGLSSTQLLEQAANQLDDNQKKDALSMGIRIAMMDGLIDTSEKQALDAIMKISNIAEEVYKPIVLEAIKGYQNLSAELEELDENEELAAMELKKSFVDS